MGQFFKSISIALQNIRANPLHTFLSTLGIIIGVAALVGILALGDGLEQTGREQLANTTSLNMITVNSKRTKTVDDIRIQIKDRPEFTIEKVQELKSLVQDKALLEYTGTRSAEINYKDSVSGIYLQGSMEFGLQFLDDSVFFGRYISKEDVINSAKIIVLSSQIADKLSDSRDGLIGETVEIEDVEFRIIGILKGGHQSTQKVFIPTSVYTELSEEYPDIVLKAQKAEQIPEIENEITQWLDGNYKETSDAFTISTNRARVEQFSQGILLFKLIMGAITGISVLVGGIGVMNVLLISVTERTKEIGIRKATGAKKKDIVLQFMAESVTISFVGCIIGWIVGIVGIFIFVPIVNSFTEIGEFRAAIGTGTVLSILVIALFVGIIFGTYPAWRAAQLTPVDAIRHE
ncbi:MAG: ABC transporter permease [Balneola sp.]|nr:ABC transporter permease [Balneola sp.]MBO6651316.1 ABC transporter permease [Balneola sp.]MBO6710808.1 ABC transporter permease [Balneola sp.]MBO6799495.1 ABC transporter permease [Balneola sp.]MBO6870227.1 ABC transporter permease [Balneola sp.]